MKKIKQGLIVIFLLILLLSIFNSAAASGSSSTSLVWDRILFWLYKLKDVNLITGQVIANGGDCDVDSDCDSGHCSNYICCESGKTCCTQYFHCDISEDCGSSGYCVPKASKKANGNICFSDSDCESNHCQNDICCGSGKICCSSNAWCSSGQECSSSYYCVEKASEPKVGNGYTCDSNDDCESGWCSAYTCCKSGEKCCQQTSHCSSFHGLSGYECNSQNYCTQITKKSNGQSCYSGSECSSGNCYNMICCESGKNCCKYASDCASGQVCGSSYYCVQEPKKSNGQWCTYSTECQSSNCQNSVCCDAGKNCCKYDYHCPAGDACGTSYYCIDVVKKSNGQSCSLNSDCESGNCKYSTCCEAGKSCCTTTSNCQSGYTCGSNYYCVQTIKKTNGQSCSSSSDCESGNCQNNLCCSSGQTCCSSNSHCPTPYVCGTSYYCIQITKKTNGQSCSSSSDCESGNCQNYICCTSGKTCCSSSSNCPSGYECGLNYYCVQPAKKSNGEYCGSNTDCTSGNCKSNTCCEAGKTCCYSNSNCPSGYTCGSSFYCLQTIKKSNGQSCTSNTDCESGNCMHNLCCAYGKACCSINSHCPTPYVCGTSYYCVEPPKKADAQPCTLASECTGNYCVHGYCRSTSTYCGDNYCEGSETYATCSADCKEIPKPLVKKADFESCQNAEECIGGYCVHNLCSSKSTLCGDGVCEGDETYTNCPTECAKPTEPILPVSQCGNNICDAEENCQTCGQDCHTCLKLCQICQGNNYCDTGYCKEMPDKTNRCDNLKGGICCGEKYTQGDCCSISDCSAGYECKSNKCKLIVTKKDLEETSNWFFNGVKTVLDFFGKLPPPEEKLNVSEEETLKQLSPDEIFMESFKQNWVIKNNAVGYWADLYDFSSRTMKENSELVVAGKSITLSKDVLDIASSFATGLGILGSVSVVGELYSIGETIYGEDTNENVANAAEWISIIGIVNDGRKAMGITSVNSAVAAIKQVAGAAKAADVADDLNKVKAASEGVSAAESFGLNIAGAIIDKAVINEVAGTVKYSASEMNEQAKMAFISNELVKLWAKYAEGTLTKDDAEKIIDLELMFYNVQLKELSIRKQYYEYQKGALDSFISYIPLLNQVSAKKNIEDIEDIEAQVHQEIKWRINAEKNIYQKFY